MNNNSVSLVDWFKINKGIMSLPKNSIFIVLTVLILNSCSLRKISKSRTEGFIFFNSVLEEDICTLSINDSILLNNIKITTDRSLGIDPKNILTLSSVSNPIKIRVSFSGNIMTSYDDPVIRNTKLDTVFDMKHGRFITLKAGIKNIEIEYSKKEIRLY